MSGARCDSVCLLLGSQTVRVPAVRPPPPSVPVTGLSPSRLTATWAGAVDSRVAEPWCRKVPSITPEAAGKQVIKSRDQSREKAAESLES